MPTIRSDVVDNSYDCLPPVDSTMVPIAWMEHPVVSLSISLYGFLKTYWNIVRRNSNIER